MGFCSRARAGHSRRIDSIESLGLDRYRKSGTVLTIVRMRARCARTCCATWNRSAASSARTGWPKLFVTAIAMKSTMPHLADLARRCCGMGVDASRSNGWFLESIARKRSRGADDATRAVLREWRRSLLPAAYISNIRTLRRGEIRSLCKDSGSTGTAGYCLFSLAK